MAQASPIASHIPGRLRLRHPDLRRPSRNAALCEALRGSAGVAVAQGNPAAGSILVHYDPAHLDRPAIEATVLDLIRPPAAEPSAAGDEDDDLLLGEEAGLSLWRMNRYAKLGMFGSLAGSLLALAVGKKAHAALGAMHVAFLFVHLANHRKRLLD